MRLRDKVAIVTGGGSGFGEGIAKRFAQEGAKVIVNDLNPVGGERVAAEINKSGGKSIFFSADVSKDSDMAKLVDTAVSTFGGLNIFVNNAGTTYRAMPMTEVPEEMFDKVFAVNVKSIFLSARYAVPAFRRQGGGVMINIASTGAVRPRPGLTWYSASKGAVIVASRSMAVELAPDKIRVNIINPVIGATGLMNDFMGGKETPEIRQKFTDSIPLGRFCTPRDVANAALFLSSDEAEFVTGASIEVDGGRCV